VENERVPLTTNTSDISRENKNAETLRSAAKRGWGGGGERRKCHFGPSKSAHSGENEQFFFHNFFAT
jgi:hypothetical protein